MDNQDISGWYKAMVTEQRKQTKLLENIRSVAYFFFVLAFLGLLGGCCMITVGTQTVSQMVGG
jgi:hypothetical protein